MNKELMQEVETRKKAAEAQRQMELEPYLKKYGSQATEMLERAFDYFASVEYDYQRHVVYGIPDNIPVDEHEKFFKVLSKINSNNTERYDFFVCFRKASFFKTAKISISTVLTESFREGFF